MISDLTANFTSDYAALRQRALRRFFNQTGAHGPSGRESRDYAHSGRAASALDEIGSLWTPCMLDHLKAPLTRYHE